ncbi:MAG: 2-oxoacid:ferredoxin oxidoreductase subunit beta [Candidatus Melainabacteria bacterium]|nr:2-oxoacid:ferredoxin oxidoreductase subunit beta [Candidatus Melainabacteria bacterium]
MTQTKELTKADFVSEGDVKWCPGCGDYAILSSVQTVLPTLGIPKEKFCFVSGIGCSSRFPYYMDTYGFHTIHGRAPTVASGVKMANPDLSVWVVTGDGDGLSIGANHTVHMIRRNMDLKVLLFNNRIYGLTKGQYSPTSEKGKVTKTSVYGSIDNPLNPVAFAIASGATFAARTNAANPKHMQEILKAAADHKGTAFVEILQNCNIFNDGAFAKYLDKETKAEENLILEEGKSLLFNNDTQGIVMSLEGSHPRLIVEEVNATDTSVSVTGKKFLVHDPKNEDHTLSYLISQLGVSLEATPTAMGVLRAVRKPTYDEVLYEQEAQAKAQRGVGILKKLIYSSDTWTVTEESQAAGV